MVMDCLFCKIAQGVIPSNFVYENETVFVIPDIHPKAKVHLLVIPKQHLATLNDITTNNQAILGELGLAVVAVTKQLNIAESGYKIVVNNGPDSGQLVSHLHWHVLGGENVQGLT